MGKRKEKIVVLGGGESGVGAAVLAKQKGFSVFLSDAGKIKNSYKQLLQQYEISFEEGQHSQEIILSATKVIKSPGIPKKAQIIQSLRERNIPIISEIEFAARYARAKIVAITGTNGKTTTTSLIYHLFKKAGYSVGMAGNIGKSFAFQVATENHDYYILEVSSFQLDDCYEFKPFVSLFLNITPDHLDEYDSYDDYARAKFRIAQSQRKEDFFIYNADDPKIVDMLEEYDFEVKKLTFGVGESRGKHARIEDNILRISMSEEDLFEMPMEDLALKGMHNVANSLAAGLAAKVCKIKNEWIREGLADFKGVPHRLEEVLTIRGVKFVNDSKATNVNAAYFALDSFQNTPLIWIAGGKDKGNDYKDLLPLVKEKVKALVCLGADNSKLIDFFKDYVETIVDTHSMEDAVQAAYALGKPGDIVLLSPACASFDLFENFEHRGDEFKKEVRKL